MNIYINNEQREIQHSKTIFQLLSELEINSSRGIAVAVNNQVIPKATWENYVFQENDKITVIKATQGG